MPDQSALEPDAPDLLLTTPLRPVEPCPQCGTPTEQGRAHICPGRPEVSR